MTHTVDDRCYCGGDACYGYCKLPVGSPIRAKMGV